ncbi:MAG: SRPBCC family protein [Candidatus Eisenbacteria bacterium]|nr:SRPBCC family protein [Candidatus Eisenbacteria bacterium]
MFRKIVLLATSVFAVNTVLAAGAGAETKQIPMVSIHSEMQIAASPAAVWSYITTGKNFVTWCPNWKAARNATIRITRVGDVLDYADEWGNGGRSIVTYCVMNKELRVAHEPFKGDYICQGKFTLTPAAGGTMLSFWDSYTDASAPKDMEATLQKMQAGSDQSLKAIQQALEKK